MTYNLNHYFDNAAATPIGEKARQMLRDYSDFDFINPSGLTMASKAVSQKLEESRHIVARLIGAKSNQIIFSSSATESNFMAIHGFVEKNPNGVVLASAVEHESVLANIPKGYACRLIPVSSKSQIRLESLAQYLDEFKENPVLVSVMFANNETGALMNISGVRNAIEASMKTRVKNAQVTLHVDASQAMNFCEIQVDRYGIDLMTLSSGKTYGPRGIASLYIRDSRMISGQIKGGGQERDMRSGTENALGAFAFASELEQAQLVRKEEHSRVVNLKQKLEDFFRNECLSHVEITAIKKQLAGTLHLRLLNEHAEDFVMKMDLKYGMILGTGSACQASSDEPSHALTAMEWAADEANSAVRISLGRYNDEQGVDDLIAALREYFRGRADLTGHNPESAA